MEASIFEQYTLDLFTSMPCSTICAYAVLFVVRCSNALVAPCNQLG
jgi:hypothetical protein